MGFLSLLVVASMPVLQFLFIGMLGAFLSSEYSNVLSASARKHINKIGFVVFSPSIVFASLARAVNLHDLLTWWYMPVNIGMIFLIGDCLGWLVVKILKPGRHLEPLVIACCSAGNLGSLMLIIVTAICHERNNPFGDQTTCSAKGLSYVAISMSIGNIYIWTHTYNIMKKSCALYDEISNVDGPSKISNKDGETGSEAHGIMIHDEDSFEDQKLVGQPSVEPTDDVGGQEKMIPLLSSSKLSRNQVSFRSKFNSFVHQTLELLEPPTLAAIVGLIVGVTPWLKSLIIGDNAPLRVIQQSLDTLGNGLLPCIILILGGNLIQGLRKATMKSSVIIAIICVRYIFLPLGGLATVKAAEKLGFLPEDPLFSYVLLLQFSLPPAFGIGTMTQLFDVGKEECSVILLWAYLVAAFALTAWSTVFLWILT